MQNNNESPESATTAPKKKPEKPDCFAHYHLTPAHHGFLDVCRSLSKGNGRRGVLYFDGEGMAARFGHRLGASTACLYANSLVKDGWLKILRKNQLSGGRYSATHYRVLDHDEWAAEHPGECDAELAAAKAKTKAKDDKRVTPAESGVVKLTALDSVSTALDSVSTALDSGGNLYLLTSNKQRIPSTSMAASRLSPLDSRVVDESVLRTDTGTGVSGSDRALSAAALDSRGVVLRTDSVPPVPRSGQGVSAEFMAQHGKKSKTVSKTVTASGSAPAVPVRNTAEAELTQRAERILQPFHRELCIALGGKRVPWLEGVKELLCHGHSEDEIQPALQYHASKYGGSYTHQSYGFKEWLKQIQREMAAEVSTTTTTTTEVAS